MQMTGIVSNVASGTGQYGQWFALEINGDRFYLAEKWPPKCKAGDTVSFDWTQAGKSKKVTKGSLSVVGSAAAALPPQAYGSAPSSVLAPAAPPSNRVQSFGDDRQDVISKQAALNSAIATVQALIAADAIPFKASSKAGEKNEIIRAMIDDFTSQYYEQATGKIFPTLKKAPSPTGADALAGAAERSADDNIPSWE